MDLNRTAIRLNKIIRDHYEDGCNNLELIVDRFSYDLLSIDSDNIYLYDFDLSISLLIKNIKRFLIFSINKCQKRYLFVYKNIFKINKEKTFSFAWENINRNIDLFVNRYCAELKNKLSKMTHLTFKDDVLNIFPIEKNKGVFHGRAKTMFYMLLYYSMFCFCSELCDQSYIYDYTDEEKIIESKGYFFSEKEKHYLWDKDRNLYKGNSIPSYFGTKELLFPITP